MINKLEKYETTQQAAGWQMTSRLVACLPIFYSSYQKTAMYSKKTAMYSKTLFISSFSGIIVKIMHKSNTLEVQL